MAIVGCVGFAILLAIIVNAGARRYWKPKTYTCCGRTDCNCGESPYKTEPEERISAHRVGIRERGTVPRR